MQEPEIQDLDLRFEEMLARWQNRIFAFCLGLAGNRADAEEIAQDTFVRAYRALGGYDSQRLHELREQGWLHRIALNCFRNRVRRRRPPQAVLGDGVAGELVSPMPGPAALAEQHETGAELRALLAELPRPLREAVVLRHVQQLSYTEAAGVLGLPVGTVKSNAHRGVLRLRRRLAELEVASVAE